MCTESLVRHPPFSWAEVAELDEGEVWPEDKDVVQLYVQVTQTLEIM